MASGRQTTRVSASRRTGTRNWRPNDRSHARRAARHQATRQDLSDQDMRVGLLPVRFLNVRCGQHRFEAFMENDFPVTHSTLAINALMTNVLPDYDIGIPLECRFLHLGLTDTNLVKTRDGQY